MRNRLLPLAGILVAVLAVGFLVNQLSDGTGGDAEPKDLSLLSSGIDGTEPGQIAPQPTSVAEPYSRVADDADREFAAFSIAGVPDSLGAGVNSAGVGGGPDSGGSGGASLSQTSLLDRQIIRTATIELTVDDVPGAVQRIEIAATGAGGFVSGSSITIEQQPPPDDPDEEQEIRQRGTITIRVPAESYASVMSTLRAIVDDPRDITSLTEDTSEVTEEYSDLQSRLRNLEATEVQYLELLARAESINDVLLVQDRLNSVRLEIEQVQGRIQLLDDLTSMATITTFLTLPPLVVTPIEPEPETETSWATEAWENAWNASEDILEAMGVAAITGGVVLVWLLIPSALLLGGWWVFTSRRGTSDTVA